MPTPKRVKEHETLQLAKVEAFILALQKAMERALLVETRNINFRDIDGGALTVELIKIQRILETFDYGPEKKRINELFANELAFVKEKFDYQNIPISYSEEDRRAVKALVNLEFQKVDAEINNWVTDVRSVLAGNVLLGNTPDLGAIADEFGERFARNVKTELNTSASMFNGEISLIKAQEVLGDNPRMQYVGPLDPLTRPFCFAHVGKVYRLSEVRKMNNGQGLDVVTAKGGYNCRHEWVYLSESAETEEYEQVAEEQRADVG